MNNPLESYPQQKHEADPTMKILRGLASEVNEFRTPKGIAHEIGLTIDDTQLLLDEIVKLGVARTPITGEESLFTIATRKPSLRERYRSIRSRVATW